MVGPSSSRSNSSTPAATQSSAAGLVAASAEAIPPLMRIAGKVRLAAAVRSQDPPADPSMVPFYVEALATEALPNDVRARLCRAITYADGVARRYVVERFPLYIEAVCAFPDDERCVLFVLALIHQGVMDGQQDLPFSQGVYAAALYYTDWESRGYRVQFGLPLYSSLRAELAELYLAEPNVITPERTALIETAYSELARRPDAASAERRIGFGRYLIRGYRIDNRDDAFTRSVQEDVQRNGQAGRAHGGGVDSPVVSAPIRGNSYSYEIDPLDDPEAILRGGSGNEADDERIAYRYVDENRPLDAAACSLFVRMVHYAENRGDEAAAAFWTVKLAHALIAVDRVDDDTRDIIYTAAELDPNDPMLELAYLYGFARDRAGDLVSGGEPEAARRLERVVIEKSAIYKPLVDRKRWDWDVLERALALSWGHRGRTDAAARGLYKQVVASNPEDRMLAILYARALAQAQVHDKSAVVAYERTVELGKATEPIRKALAIAYAKTGAAKDDSRRGTALRLWEEMYRTGMADDAEIVAALADAYDRDDSATEIAVAIWEKAAKADPKNGKIRVRLGREMLSQGDTTSAVKYLKEAAKLLPDDFEAQYHLGRLLHERNENATAVKYLQKAVALPGGNKNRDAHFALGECLLALEIRDEARKVFEKITETMDPNHAPSLLHLANLNLRYEEEGVKKAEALYEKAAKADPKGSEGYKRLASLRKEQGRFGDAEAALEKYLALSSTDANAARQLADLYLKRGDYVKAESALRQTVALGGGDKKLFAQLGEVIVQAQKQREAQSNKASTTVKADRTSGIPEAVPVRQSIRQTVPVETRPEEGGEEVRVRRQPLVTQKSVVEPEPAPTPAAPVVETPAMQNLTRSVGAAAIKAALRNRAARLAASNDNNSQ